MRDWMNALNEGVTTPVQKAARGGYEFFKMLEGLTAPARPAFGKRKAAEPAPVQTPEYVEADMIKAIEAVADAVTWSGMHGADELIGAAAHKFGVDPEKLRAAITPEMICNWQR